MLMERCQGGWKPADNEASAYSLKAQPGQLHDFKVTKPRNARFSRKFWSMVSLVANNQDRIQYSTVKQGNERLIFAACYILKLGEFWGKNKEHFERKSFAFNNMSEDEFSECYNQILDVFLKHFVKVDQKEFERELLSYG